MRLLAAWPQDEEKDTFPQEIRPVEMTKGETSMMAAKDLTIRRRIHTAYRLRFSLSFLDIGRPPPIEHDDAEQLVSIVRKPAAVLFPQPLNDVPAQHARSPSYSHALTETPS